MATLLDRVVDNTIWRIESLTATEQSITTNPFRHVDPLRLDPEAVALRGFSVRWTGSDEDHDVQDGYDRTSDSTLQLEVYYRVGPAGLAWLDAQRLILRDRHDIIKALRDPNNRVGFNADNTATDIGLYRRFRLGDELDADSDSTWALRMQWACTVREVE